MNSMIETTWASDNNDRITFWNVFGNHFSKTIICDRIDGYHNFVLGQYEENVIVCRQSNKELGNFVVI